MSDATKARVIAPFQGHSEDELTVDKDTIVQVIQYDVEPGWTKCREVSGKVGLIPSNYLTAVVINTANNSNNNNHSMASPRQVQQQQQRSMLPPPVSAEQQQLYVTVLYDYNALHEPVDMTVSVGQLLRFISYGSDGTDGYSLCLNTRTKQEGFIPTSYHTEPARKSLPVVPSLPTKKVLPNPSSPAKHESNVNNSPKTQPPSPLGSPQRSPSAVKLQQQQQQQQSPSPPPPSKQQRSQPQSEPQKNQGPISNNNNSTPKKDENIKPSTSASTPTAKATTTPATSTDAVSKEMKKRRELIKEVIKTEESYVFVMTIFWEVNAQKARQLSQMSEKDWVTLFGNVELILGANRALLDGLKRQVELVGQGNEENCCIGKVFSELAPYFKMYTDFINNYDSAIDTVERLSKHKYFKNYLQECEDDPRTLEARQSCSIHSLLINPIQRIPRYQLLLQGISEVTDEKHPDQAFIKTALKQICEIAQHCNQSKAVSNALGVYYKVSATLGKELKYESFIQSHRRFICECLVVSHISDEPRISNTNTAAVVAQNLKKSLKKLAKDANILTSPRASLRQPISLPESGEELYHAYLFNDSIVIERDTTYQESRKYIDLFFLQYTNVVCLQNNSALLIDTISDNKKRSITLKPRDSTDEDYMIKFETLRTQLLDAIEAVSSKYEQRLKIEKPLNQYANDRLHIENQRRLAQRQLNDTLLMALDSRKKLHRIEDEIERKEDQLRRLQEELSQLREDRSNFIMVNKTSEVNVKEHDRTLQSHLQDLSQIDSVLIASLNDEASSFQRVFADEPCVIRSPAGDTVEDKMDLYRGQKLRRKLTLSGAYDSIPNADYSAFEQSSMKENLNRIYGDKQVLFSSMIYSVNAKGQAGERRMVITESAINIIKTSGNGVRTRMPITAVTCISVSSSDDNFFCVHSAELNDLLLFSTKKTEIIDVLRRNYQELGRGELFVQVATSVVFVPTATAIKKLRIEPRVLDSDFEITKQDSVGDSWRIKYDPNGDDSSFRMNKTFLQKDKTHSDSAALLFDSTSANSADIYKGNKVRRRASIDRKLYGDYLSVTKSSDIKKLPEPSSAIIFFDEVHKVNEHFKTQTRILIITEKMLYYVDPLLKNIKGSIALSDIGSVSVSYLADNYFCLHVASGMDILLCSEKKTEILQILQKYCPNSAPISLTNTFHFRRKNKDLVGTFTENLESTETVFQMTSSSTFSVSVSRKLKSAIVFESMEVNIDGLGLPVILFPDSSMNPCIKLPTSSTFFTCTLSYYAMENIKGYHIEQSVGSLSNLNTASSSTSIEDTPKSDKKHTVSLKRQKLSVNFGRLGSTTVKTRILDNFGNEVCLFKFHVQV